MPKSTARRTANCPKDLHSTLEQRRCWLGAVLELARALNASRLVRALEAHANTLRRQIEAP